MVWVSRIANAIKTTPLIADTIQPNKMVVHSGLFIDKSLRKIDFCSADVEVC